MLRIAPLFGHLVFMAAALTASVVCGEEIQVVIEGVPATISGRAIGGGPPATVPAAGQSESPEAENDLALTSDGKHVSVRFADGSILKLDLNQETYEVVTPYGKLNIPATELRLVELAPRVAEGIAKQIEEAVANLGSPQFEIREKAAADLIKVGPQGYPVLLQFASPKDPEVAGRMEEILDKVREQLPDDQAEPRKWDVIHTPHSKICGRIQGSVIKAVSPQFGDVNLRLADVRDMYFPGEMEVTNLGKLEAAPPNLYDKAHQIGKTFAYKVTGASGSLYGTDVYTLDSSLAAAAVHAGVVKLGATGVVRVKIVESPESFVSTTRHGITSSAWGRYSAAYKILKR